MAQPNDSVCEEKVFETTFTQYAQILRNFIYYKCGDSARADDLVQEAFVTLWKNCAKVPFAKAKS